jgi:DNA repair protein RadC
MCYYEFVGRKAYTIHDLPDEEKPREQLQRVGISNLSQQELVAIIIEKGCRGENALQLAQRLISKFSSVENLSKATLEQLISVKGIGPAKACKLKAAFRLGQINNSKPITKKKIQSAEDIFKLVKDKIGEKEKEFFLLICLDSRNCATSQEVISIGTLNSSLSHPREIFKSAIDHRSAAIILCHNHPSGDVQPSRSDLKLTEKLIRVGQLVDIPILDHVIVSSTNYFSFKEAELM